MSRSDINFPGRSASTTPLTYILTPFAIKAANTDDFLEDLLVLDSTASAVRLAAPAARDDHHGNDKNDHTQEERKRGRHE